MNGKEISFSPRCQYLAAHVSIISLQSNGADDTARYTILVQDDTAVDIQKIHFHSLSNIMPTDGS